MRNADRRLQNADLRFEISDLRQRVRGISVSNSKFQISNLFFAAGVLALAFYAQSGESQDKSPAPKFTTESLRGRVVFLAEALEKKYGVKSVPEAKEAALALHDEAGKLHPLVEDTRGRAFRADKRLRGMNVELLVRRYQDSPAAQIVRVYEIAKDGRFEIDYWCEVCSIAMYELKQCECCQGPIELRKRKSDEK